MHTRPVLFCFLFFLRFFRRSFVYFQRICIDRLIKQCHYRCLFEIYHFITNTDKSFGFVYSYNEFGYHYFIRYSYNIL